MTPPWGQLLMVRVLGQSAHLWTRTLIEDYQVGGVVVFGSNVADFGQLATLTRDLQQLSLRATGLPLFIAVDQEGGPIQRLGPPFPQTASAQTLGTTARHENVERLAVETGRRLRSLGFNMNLAPVLDVVRSASCPLWERSYGSDPEAVARLGEAAVRGYLASGVIPVGKHFPGLGTTDRDSHQELPMIRGTRAEAEQDLLPFRRAIAAGLPAMLCAHVTSPWDTTTPASLSPAVVRGLLRATLGFQGLVLTDDLSMNAISDVARAAVRALDAGADQLLVCSRWPQVVPLVHRALCASGLTMRLEESLERIRRAKQPLTLDARFGSPSLVKAAD